MRHSTKFTSKLRHIRSCGFFSRVLRSNNSINPYPTFRGHWRKNNKGELIPPNDMLRLKPPENKNSQHK